LFCRANRIRHYGLLASGVKADNLVLARKLLDVAPPAREPEDIASEPPTPLKPCPCYGSAMRIIEVFEGFNPRLTRPIPVRRLRKNPGREIRGRVERCLFFKRG
jgi:hypothetical protein